MDKLLVEKEPTEEKIRELARETLASGIPGLQFDTDLEQNFENYYCHRYWPLNRVYLLAGALVMAILTFTDQLILPNIMDQVLAVRIPTIVFIGAVFLLSQLRVIIPHLPLLLCLTTCTIHVSLIIIAAYAALAGEFHYQGGTVISVVYACLVLRLQFHYVLPLAMLMWFTQVLGMHFFMVQPFTEFIEIFVVHTIVTILSIAICYRSEHEVRRSFLLQILQPEDRFQPPKSVPEACEWPACNPISPAVDKKISEHLASDTKIAETFSTGFTLIQEVQTEKAEIKANNSHDNQQINTHINKADTS
jgi:hypothetical protein